MDRYMIFNPETGEIFTRTPMSWLKITAFYVVYYSLLAAFWLICLQIFFFSLPEGKPKYDFWNGPVRVGCGFGQLSFLEGTGQAEHFAGTMGAQQLKGYFF